MVQPAGEEEIEIILKPATLAPRDDLPSGSGLHIAMTEIPPHFAQKLVPRRNLANVSLANVRAGL